MLRNKIPGMSSLQHVGRKTDKEEDEERKCTVLIGALQTPPDVFVAKLCVEPKRSVIVSFEWCALKQKTTFAGARTTVVCSSCILRCRQVYTFHWEVLGYISLQESLICLNKQTNAKTERKTKNNLNLNSKKKKNDFKDTHIESCQGCL